jgi:hypothetical protein
MVNPGPEKLIKAREDAYKVFKNLFDEEPGKAFIQIWSLNGEMYCGFDDEVGYHLLEADPNLLVKEAYENGEGFNMLTKAVAHALSNDLEIPKPAKIFIADYLLNPKIRPPMKAGKPSNYAFNWTLRLALLGLAAAGVPPSRNDATYLGHDETGIDIVLEILQELNQLGDRNHENLQRLYFRTMKKFPLHPSN